MSIFYGNRTAYTRPIKKPDMSLIQQEFDEHSNQSTTIKIKDLYQIIEKMGYQVDVMQITNILQCYLPESQVQINVQELYHFMYIFTSSFKNYFIDYYFFTQDLSHQQLISKAQLQKLFEKLQLDFEQETIDILIEDQQIKTTNNNELDYINFRLLMEAYES